MPTAQALARARELGLDLVEVAADVRPPVCRIMDYGKFKYEQSKKDKASKARSKTTELKEVRMGRSMKIDPHDVAIRLKKAREFLMEGHKVQIVQQFKGREMQHRSRGDARMKEIMAELADIGKVEVFPRMFGRRMSMIIGPDKAKIDQARRKLDREARQRPQDGAASEPGEGAATTASTPETAEPAAKPTKSEKPARVSARPRKKAAEPAPQH
jgi:translation initiation factor IF-3